MKPRFWADEVERALQLTRGAFRAPVHDFVNEIERHRHFFTHQPSLHERAMATVFDDIYVGNAALRSALEINTGSHFLRGVDLQSQLLAHSFDADIEHQRDAAKLLSERLADSFNGILELNRTVIQARQALLPAQLGAKISDAESMLSLNSATRSLLSEPNQFMAALSREMLRASSDVGAFARFETSVSSQLLALTKGITRDAEAEDDKIIQRLFALIMSHIARITGRIDFAGWVQIFLAIATYVESSRSAARDHKAVMDSLNEIDAAFKRAAIVVKSQPVAELRMVDSKTLRVREAATTDSKIVARLTEGALVRMIGGEKAWAEIEYFNFVEAKTKTGWVAKQHLMELPDEFEEDETQPEP